MDSTEDVIIIIACFFVIAVFAPTALTTWQGLNDNTTDYDIKTIQQNQKDCLIKEYYYLDEHRTFCDKIGVTP